GAIERRIGRFELAAGGTIFLDEVGELPPETQVKLLRVLQEHEFEPVGSSRTVSVSVRVIAACNRDLEDAARSGRFRPDLFYRLNVVPIEVPALRERRVDIPQLVMFFLARFAKKFGKKVDTVADDTMERLRQYSWPGNVRELQNALERAVVLARGPMLEVDPSVLAVAGSAASSADDSAGVVSPPGRPTDGRPTAEATVPDTAGAHGVTLEEVERNHIVATLTRTGWVIDGPKGAAQILALHPNTLRSRMEKLGIKRPRPDVS